MAYTLTASAQPSMQEFGKRPADQLIWPALFLLPVCSSGGGVLTLISVP
jgi:hypothetical protein